VNTLKIDTFMEKVRDRYHTHTHTHTPHTHHTHTHTPHTPHTHTHTHTHHKLALLIHIEKYELSFTHWEPWIRLRNKNKSNKESLLSCLVGVWVTKPDALTYTTLFYSFYNLLLKVIQETKFVKATLSGRNEVWRKVLG
jgi:hypothetical protein